MATLHFQVQTPLSPRHALDRLTDFSPARAHTWPNIDTKHFQVHTVGASWADVTEGSSVLGGTWERLRYTWDPLLMYVTAYTHDSNLWANNSGWEYKLTPHDGGTRITVTVIRQGKNLKGRLVALFLSLFGTDQLRSHLAHALAV
jgi:hypothetical protein